MSKIHPTAIVDPRAEISEDVEIGPCAIIQGHVVLGRGTVVKSHSMIEGHAVIGNGCTIGPTAFVGMPPQHLANPGVGTSTYIGDGTIIRELAQVHRATKPGPEHATRVGARCFMMAASHVGHDSKVGDDVVMANAVLIGGHCVVGDRAFLGGGSGLHQFVRMGRLAISCGNEAITRDVPPFAAVRYCGLKGYNAVGCKRSGMSREAITAVRAAYRCFHSHRTTPAVIAAIKQNVPLVPEVEEFLDFLMARSRRGLQPSVRFLTRPDPFDDAVD